MHHQCNFLIIPVFEIMTVHGCFKFSIFNRSFDTASEMICAQFRNGKKNSFQVLLIYVKSVCHIIVAVI